MSLPHTVAQDWVADVEIHITNSGIGKSRFGDVDAVQAGVTSTRCETSQKMAPDEPGAAERHGVSVGHNRSSFSVSPAATINITHTRLRYSTMFMSLLLLQA